MIQTHFSKSYFCHKNVEKALLKVADPNKSMFFRAENRLRWVSSANYG